ncbi:MAG: DNA polymerase III subunit gamma/tau [Planctomycetota bacterium]
MSQSPHQAAGNDGSYVVVARRYRPRGFDELVGQEHVGRALKNAIETGRVGHAYLFTGARGVGKTSTARIFAKALNDPSGPTASPDNDSDIALAIDAGEDVDVIEIDGASNRGIDEIRSLRANVGVRPSRCRYKIYIIDEVHMLTPAAFNALLKTLEEPPEHVKFIFCTTDPEKIPITVLSRCQRFDFAPVEVPKIVERLAEIVQNESAQADASALELIARRAAGSMRDSQSLLEQVLSFSDGNLTADQVHAMLGTADDERLHALAKSMSQRDAATTIAQVDAAVDAGVDAGRLAEQLLGYFRDMMAASVGCDANLMRHTAASMHGELQSLGQNWGLQTVLAVVELLDQTLVRIGRSVHGRVLLEAALIQICSLPDLQHIADLAAAANVPGEKKKVRRPANPIRPAAAGIKPDSGDSATDASPVIREAIVPDRATEPSVPASDGSSQPVSIATKAPKEASTSPPESGRDPRKEAAGASAETEASVAVMTTQSAVPWTQPNVDSMWPKALASLESMTQTFARVVERVQPIGDNGLRLVFPADADLALKRCQLPEHQSALIEAIAPLAGRTIRLEFISAPKPRTPAVEPTTTPRPSRQQRMREIEGNALIKSCVDLFEAEIVRVEKPKPK